MGIQAAKVRVGAGAANPERLVGEGLLAPLEPVARRVVLAKGPGVGLVLLAQRRGQRVVRMARAQRGGPTRDHPEAQPRARPLSRTDNQGCGQKAARVVRARRVVRLVVRAHLGRVPVVRRVAVGLVSPLAGALKVVPATAMPTVQVIRVRRLVGMIGSPKGQQRMSRVWALQSLREATARPPLGGC